jgi:hypothetical protein
MQYDLQSHQQDRLPRILLYLSAWILGSSEHELKKKKKKLRRQ